MVIYIGKIIQENPGGVRGRGDEADIKSNNPHLTAGEQIQDVFFVILGFALSFPTRRFSGIFLEDQFLPAEEGGENGAGFRPIVISVG